jgi:group I intron endonuclease
MLSIKDAIGSSSNLRKRMVVHCDLSVRAKDTRIISRALSKYGEENFSLIILDHGFTAVSVLLELEQLALDLWLPEYNIYKIAGSPLGFTHSDETRALMSSNRQGEDNKFYGKTHTQGIKDLLSMLNTGEGHPNYGKKRSLETVNKMITSSSYRAKPVFCYSWEDRSYICSQLGELIKWLEI